MSVDDVASSESESLERERGREGGRATNSADVLIFAKTRSLARATGLQAL